MSEEWQDTEEILDEETPVPEQPETEDATKGKKFTFSSKKEYKKHIKGEKARQKAIEKARAKYQPLEDELQAEKERTKRMSDGETVEPRQKKSFCERHPKVCKVGKGVAVAGAAVGTAALVGAAAAESAGEVLYDMTTGGSSRKETSRPSKTKSAPKRTASTPKRRTTSQKARKPTQKRSATSKAGKSTPKRRTTSQSKTKAVPQSKRKSSKATTKSPKRPKRPRESDWWGYGDAGL